jgi:hypothetical protein
MQLVAMFPFEWKTGGVQRGWPVEAGPDDGELVAYWSRLGALVDLDSRPPPPTEPGNGGGGEGGGEGGEPGRRPLVPREREASETAVLPMTSTDHPSHVGRRVRPSF